ncbi:Uncharacterised protein [Vibrio cholerae]|nr:Uncharacterised protein [Vibrio cholerae]CSC69088.1 Uncharacterised protein [Vibrio cholerae]CSI44540.1 Uncharacterised protein [Vibrio cholerae]
MVALRLLLENVVLNPERLPKQSRVRRRARWPAREAKPVESLARILAELALIHHPHNECCPNRKWGWDGATRDWLALA